MRAWPLNSQRKDVPELTPKPEQGATTKGAVRENVLTSTAVLNVLLQEGIIMPFNV